MDSKKVPLEHVFSESPWQPRINVELERQNLASKCQSFSSLMSPWVTKDGQLPKTKEEQVIIQSSSTSESFPSIHSPLQSPNSLTSGSSADLSNDDDFLDGPSPFLKEFQNAARQLEELALGVSVDDRSVTSEEYNSCDQFLSSVDATFVGWTLCTRDELRNDPQKALEESITKILNDLSDSAGSWSAQREVKLQITPKDVRIEFKEISKSITKNNVRIWGIVNDKFGMIFKVNGEYECHVFCCDDIEEIQNFCQMLSEISKVDLRKCSSISSLVMETDRSKIDFQVECQYQGSIPIGPDYRADIRQVHQIINALQSKQSYDSYCTISSTSMSILPRPGSIVLGPPNASNSKKNAYMRCRLRYISFFAVGIDPTFLAVVSVLGPTSVCHVIQVKPNALRLSDVLQEQIILRYQKAVEAKKIVEKHETDQDKPMMSSIINMLPTTTTEPVKKESTQESSSRWRNLFSLVKKT